METEKPDEPEMPEWLRKLTDSHPPGTVFIYEAEPQPLDEDHEDDAKGPRGEKRPGDVIGAAIMVAKIATGEVEDNATPKTARAEIGARGGKRRAETMTPARRSEIAKRAAKARWETPPVPSEEEGFFANSGIVHFCTPMDDDVAASSGH